MDLGDTNLISPGIHERIVTIYIYLDLNPRASIDLLEGLSTHTWQLKNLCRDVLQRPSEALHHVLALPTTHTYTYIYTYTTKYIPVLLMTGAAGKLSDWQQGEGKRQHPLHKDNNHNITHYTYKNKQRHLVLAAVCSVA